MIDGEKVIPNALAVTGLTEKGCNGSKARVGTLGNYISKHPRNLTICRVAANSHFVPYANIPSAAGFLGPI